MKNSISKQAGLTLISWIVVIVFLLFQGVIAMNVIPVYMTDATVTSILDELPSDSGAQRASIKELKRLIEKRFSINNVYSIKPSDIKIKKGRGEKIVLLHYEPRGKLIGTLDYIVTFDHEVRVPTR